MTRLGTSCAPRREPLGAAALPGAAARASRHIGTVSDVPGARGRCRRARPPVWVRSSPESPARSWSPRPADGVPGCESRCGAQASRARRSQDTGARSRSCHRRDARGPVRSAARRCCEPSLRGRCSRGGVRGLGWCGRRTVRRPQRGRRGRRLAGGRPRWYEDRGAPVTVVHPPTSASVGTSAATGRRVARDRGLAPDAPLVCTLGAITRGPRPGPTRARPGPGTSQGRGLAPRHRGRGICEPADLRLRGAQAPIAALGVAIACRSGPSTTRRRSTPPQTSS